MSTPSSFILSLERRRILQTAGSFFLSCSLEIGHAQISWPSKPIRLVLPSGAGGGADIFGRPLAEWLIRELGQPVVVENKPGANGVIAHEQVVRQPGDGHTLLISFAGAILGNKAMNAKISHDTMTDLKPIGLIGSDFGNLLVVNAASPIKNIKDLIAYAKAQSGGLNYGSWGIGSGGHLVMETLKEQAGIPLNHVPSASTSRHLIQPDRPDLHAVKLSRRPVTTHSKLRKVKKSIHANSRIKATALTATAANPAPSS